MCSKIEVPFKNLAWLSENCLAAYLNFFVIGQLNENLGFNANEYIKFRFVDFLKFYLVAEAIVCFFQNEAYVLQEDSAAIIETETYNLYWKGTYNVKTKVKQVCLISKFHNFDEKFELHFNSIEFNYLLVAFSNVAIDVFCIDPAVKSALKHFVEGLREKDIHSCKTYFQNLKREDCAKISLELCGTLNLESYKSFEIESQLMIYKFDLYLIKRVSNLCSAKYVMSPEYSQETEGESSEGELSTETLQNFLENVDVSATPINNIDCNSSADLRGSVLDQQAPTV